MKGFYVVYQLMLSKLLKKAINLTLLFCSGRQRNVPASRSWTTAIARIYFSFAFNWICGAAFSKIAKHVNQISSFQIKASQRNESLLVYPFNLWFIPETTVYTL